MAKPPVDLSGLQKKLMDASGIANNVMPAAFKHFQDITPKKKGNAKRNTKLSRNEIQAKYPYAEKLDEGYSKQAPNGMSESTVKLIEKLVNQNIAKLK